MFCSECLDVKVKEESKPASVEIAQDDEIGRVCSWTGLTETGSNNAPVAFPQSHHSDFYVNYRMTSD